MIRTSKEEFRVASRQNNHIWFEVLTGDDQGLRVSIPIIDESYSQELTDKIQTLSAGRVIEATLVSETKRPPHWKVESLETLDVTL